jgi:hypothetical protein
MSEYTLSNPAAVIDAAISSVAGADNTPTASSQNMVTSGGVKTYVDTVVSSLYPVGSVYLNATNSTNPTALLGFGTWIAFGAGRVPVGIDPSQSDFDVAEETGGAKTHTLTTAEIPSHRHVGGICDNSSGAISFGSASGSSSSSLATNSANGNRNPYTNYVGGGQSHNNLQPYIVVYMWKRTA